jgi:phosphomannomutase/phosphoglucomutase
MMWDVSIFKACDIRGRYGTDLMPEVAEGLGLAVGTELAGGSVVVGGDLRPSTEPLKEALIQGLVAAGCRVVDVGILPTPAFYFAKDYLEAEGGVMVTGSHNPPGDNGFKISLGPWPITEAELAALERRMASRDFVQGTGSYESAEVIDHYKTFIRSKFPNLYAPSGRKSGDVGGGLSSAASLKQGQLPPGGGLPEVSLGIKVVVDAGNGCYARIAPDVLRELGYEVVELYCEPDGCFPGRSPNPAVAANLQSLGDTVVGAGADLGAAFDGDGDRVVFVDERGRVVESDRSLVLFARYLLRREPGVVVYDLKCSSVVPEAVRQAGGAPVMERSGHAFIKTTLLRRKAILGGEISGHFFFGELGGDDGLYATLLMLQIVAEDGRGLAALADTVPRYPITPDIRLPCPPQETGAIVRELEQAFAQEEGCELSTLDGVRIAWPDGWALIRPSVTEPLITLRFEAHTEERLAQIQEIVVARSPRLAKLMG